MSGSADFRFDVYIPRTVSLRPRGRDPFPPAHLPEGPAAPLESGPGPNRGPEERPTCATHVPEAPPAGGHLALLQALYRSKVQWWRALKRPRRHSAQAPTYGLVNI